MPGVCVCVSDDIVFPWHPPDVLDCHVHRGKFWSFMIHALFRVLFRVALDGRFRVIHCDPIRPTQSSLRSWIFDVVDDILQSNFIFIEVSHSL